MINKQLDNLLGCVSRIRAKIKKEKSEVYEICDKISGMDRKATPTAEALQLMFNFRYLMKHCDDLEAELRRLKEED